MDLQNLINAISNAAQNTRSNYHLTLGDLISHLNDLPEDSLINPPICEAHSYRGYYSDLAFRQSSDPVTVGQLLSECRAALGSDFVGYKGGEYTMTETTPLWLADYGSTGLAIVGIDGASLIVKEME